MRQTTLALPLQAIKPQPNLKTLLSDKERFGFDGWGVRAEDTLGETIEIRIYDVISDWFGVSASEIAAKLSEFPNAKQINVRTNSPGGDAFAGVAISNLLRQHKANVTGYVDGYAASAATIALMGCDEIYMGEGSMWMIHQPWTFAYGNAEDFRDTANFLDKVNAQMIDLYTRFTGAEREHIAEMVNAETWLSADEAVAEGFAEKVLREEQDAGEADGSASNRSKRSAKSEDTASDYVRALNTAWRSANATAAALNQATKQPPAERVALSKESNNMDKSEKDAFEAQITLLSNQLKEANDKATGASNKATSLETANAELKNQLVEGEKVLAEARATIKAHETKITALNEQVVKAEVNALVGDKITADEVDRFTRLALKDKDLFNEMIASRPAMSLKDRVVKDLPASASATAAAAVTDDEVDPLEAAINKAKSAA
jgi:ATP-dependent Clp protease protease subunit